jgi:hypothetical protein
VADKMTTTETMGAKKTPKKDADPDAAVNDAIAALREALIAAGMDEATADAKLGAVAPAQTNIVGNFADLQRMGAMLVDEEGGIADAFPAPPDPPTAAEEASAGEVR